jgi:uncharacterized protein (DUF58 family)
MSTAAATLGGLRGEAEQLGARLPGLLVEAERVATTVSQGVHGRRRTGVGETFWQYRQYQPGDAAGSIDWRQSARSRHLFVREQEWEAAESVWLWPDQSASMNYRSRNSWPTKRDRTLVLTLAVAGLLVRAGERIAALGAGERPRGGQYGFNIVVQRILEGGVAAASVVPHQDLPRHARLVLVSDFLEPPEALARRFSQLNAVGAQVSLLLVADPAEEALDFQGRVLFEGLEGEGRTLIGNVGGIRERYRDLYRAHRAHLADLARKHGWQIATHHTDKSPESGLLTLYQMLAPRAAGRH